MEKSNEQVYLDLSIYIIISKIVMYEFWCYYLKLKYGGKVKLCYVDTGSVIIYIKLKMLKQDLILKIIKKEKL